MTRMTIYMANQSVTYPHGIIEDLLVNFGKCIFPLDFVVLDMKEEEDITFGVNKVDNHS